MNEQINELDKKLDTIKSLITEENTSVRVSES